MEKEFLTKLLRVLGLWLALFTSDAFAFIDPPSLVPSIATAGQTIGLSITLGICDLLFADVPPQISRTGNTVKVLLAISHQDDPNLCFGSEPYTEVFNVGEFAAGQYIVQVDRHYTNLAGEDVVEHLGMLPLVVTAKQIVDLVPDINPPASFLLGTLLILIVAIRFRSTK